MKYRAAIFDLDGTLVDTNDKYINLVVGKTLHALGVTPTDNIGSYAEFAHKFWKGFQHRDDLVRGLGLDVQQFWKTFTSVDSMDERVANSFAYNDCIVLNEWQARGVKTGIVTDAPSWVAERELRLIPHQFDYVVCASRSRGIPEKPDTRGLLMCLENVGACQRSAVYVGNANVDVAVGKNAGIHTGIIVREEGYKLEHTPDFFIKNLAELGQRLFD